MQYAMLGAKPMDSHTLMAVIDNTAGDFVSLWDVRNGQAVARSHGSINQGGNQRGLATSPNGRYMALGCTSTGSQPLVVLDNWSYAAPVALAPTGLGDTRIDFEWYGDQYLYSLNGVSSYAVDVWDVPSGANTSLFETAGAGYILNALNMTEDRQVLVATGTSSPYVEAFNLSNPLAPVYMTRPASGRQANAARPWGNSVYVCDGGSSAIERYVRVGSGAAATVAWTGTSIIAGIPNGTSIRGLGISQGGKLVVSTGQHSSQINVYQLAPDGNSATFLWSMGTYDTFPSGATQYLDVDISQDGRYIAAYSNQGVGSAERGRLWDIRSGTPVRLTLPGATTGRPWQKIRFSQGVL